MGFFSSLFGIAPGPTQSAQDFASRQNQLALTMGQDFSQRFGEQSDIFKNINRQLAPIANLGPSNQGFSPQELAAMNTQAINTSGAAARNAQQAVAGTLAGQGGGGTSGLVSGIQEQIRGTIASSAANQLAGAENEITQRNYETGRENFWRATSGEQSLANAENPTPYGQMAESTLNEAQKSAAQIDAEKQARANSWGGLAKGIIGAGLNVATGGMSGLATRAISTAKNFFGPAQNNLAQSDNANQSDDGSGA